MSFRVGPYDRSRPLVIDPVLLYSTYLGGTQFEEGTGIAVDSAGNAYVTGFTTSPNFPTQNPNQPFGGPVDTTDAFITKLDPTGSMLVYSTFLGGRGNEFGLGIAADASAKVHQRAECAVPRLRI